MIRIIKHGQKLYNIQCKSCGCIFECTEDEFEDVPSSSEDYVQITCPDCRTKLNFWNKSKYVK